MNSAKNLSKWPPHRSVLPQINPLEEGILLLDKERGRTSFYYVKLLRRHTHIKKIGHAGILDPFATGVMVMLIGRTYTQMSDRFLNESKEYVATLRFGVATNTFDCDGQVSHTSSKIPTLDAVEETLQKFQGAITQIPPMFSTKKINGQRLYSMARKGIEVVRCPIHINVQIRLLNYSYPHLTLHIACSKGTYVRTLAHDIGVKLKCFAHLEALQRTRSGAFRLEDCIDAKSLSNPSFSYLPHLRKHI